MTISSASLFALAHGVTPSGDLSGTKTGTVSDTLHGDGTFAATYEIVNGQKTVDKTVTYADGTQKSKERVITLNEDGSKTILKMRNGKTTTIHESTVKNEDGTVSIAKDVTTAKGESKQISGTISKANGEKDMVLSCTNSEGQTETITHTTVRDGNVTTHTKSGTDWYGNPIYDESTWTTFV